MIDQFPEVFDSSILATAKSCHQLFNKIYLQQWKSKEQSVHLHAGGAFAKGIETARVEFFVNHRSAPDSVALGLGALLAAYGNFECPPDSAKSAERMAGALEFYFDRYPLGEKECPPVTLPGGKRGIEFSFAHPLPIDHPVTGNPIIYCGRMDALLEYAGAPFIVDEKTTTSLGPTWSRQWDLRSQFTGYAWGCRESGVRVQGAIIRGVSILKTKYDTQEAITYRPEWQIDRWYNQTVELITELKWRWQRYQSGDTLAFPYNLDHSCADYGGCAFRQICASQDEQPWLETYFERRHWDPITRQETKL
jgi:hypothetical protein